MSLLLNFFFYDLFFEVIYQEIFIFLLGKTHFVARLNRYRGLVLLGGFKRFEPFNNMSMKILAAASRRRSLGGAT